MGKIYGVDPNSDYNAKDVRDAIIKCFKEAHKDALQKDLKDMSEGMSEEDMKEFIDMDIQMLIEKTFKEVGGDFKNPDKETIIQVCNKLADFSKNFRCMDRIKNHYNEMFNLIENLEE